VATALVLVLIVAFWAFTGGFLEIFAAFRSGEMAGSRALFIVSGLVSIAFGVVLFSGPASARSRLRSCSACSA